MTYWYNKIISSVLILLFLYGSIIAEAELVFDAARKVKINDPKESYENSLGNYEHAYVGKFSFDTIRIRAGKRKSEAYFDGKFSIESTLKSKVEFDKVSVDYVGISGCVAKGYREEFQLKLDAVAVANGLEATKKMEDLIGALGHEKSDCLRFVAVRMIQGGIDDIYKSRYELIFEDFTYVLFFNRYSVAKKDEVSAIGDVMVYDKSFMQPEK